MATAAATQKKLAGAFYTPTPIAHFLVTWAVRKPSDWILDPGAGNGVFLRAALHRLRTLGMVSSEPQVFAVELDATTASLMDAKLREEFGPASVWVVGGRDFFTLQPAALGQAKALHGTLPLVDAVVGNPPYIRYHYFSGPTRQLALKAAEDTGVRLSGLTSSWAPYVIHAAKFLKPRGRLALVLPAELLHADYAAPVRQWLVANFADITVVTFVERVFPGALEDVILLLAQHGPTPRNGASVNLVQLRNLDDLDNLTDAPSLPRAELDMWAGKWTGLLLYAEDRYLVQELLSHPAMDSLGAVATIDIGVVTGADKFFLVSDADAQYWHIEPEYLRPAVSKAADINGAVFGPEDWNALRREGKRAWLLDVSAPQTAIKHGVRTYLEHGSTRLGICTRYKIRTRSPWHRVPGVYAPDAFMTYMSYDHPRLTLNRAHAVSTNTVHRVRFTHEVDPEVVVASFYNTLTLLSAELVGRHYGGGVLKLETKEAESVRVPIRLKDTLQERVKELLPSIDELVRRRRFSELRNGLDAVVLGDGLGLSTGEIHRLWDIYDRLRSRRLAKNRSAHVQPSRARRLSSHLSLDSMG